MVEEFVRMVLAQLGAVPDALGQEEWQRMFDEHVRLAQRSIGVAIAQSLTDEQRRALEQRTAGRGATPDQLLEVAYDFRPPAEVNKLVASGLEIYARGVGANL